MFQYLLNYILPIKSECKSSLAVALFSGVFTKHRDTRSINCGDHLSLSRKVGGGLEGIINIALDKQNVEIVKIVRRYLL